jgi:hypothetical protein
VSRLLYKWIAPVTFVMRLRYIVEDFLQKPLDSATGEADR